MKTENQQQIRSHIRQLGWSDSRRTRAGEWFAKSTPRHENNWKAAWTPHPLFKTDAEALASLHGRLPEHIEAEEKSAARNAAIKTALIKKAGLNAEWAKDHLIIDFSSDIK